jgi:hypothetical protein
MSVMRAIQAGTGQSEVRVLVFVTQKSTPKTENNPESGLRAFGHRRLASEHDIVVLVRGSDEDRRVLVRDVGSEVTPNLTAWEAELPHVGVDVGLDNLHERDGLVHEHFLLLLLILQILV